MFLQHGDLEVFRLEVSCVYKVTGLIRVSIKHHARAAQNEQQNNVTGNK